MQILLNFTKDSLANEIYVTISLNKLNKIDSYFNGIKNMQYLVYSYGYYFRILKKIRFMLFRIKEL